MLLRRMAILIGLLAALPGVAAELTTPALRWAALGGGIATAATYTRPYWDLEIAAEVQRYLYEIRIREAANTGYFLPCQQGELRVCRRNIGFSDLNFMLGRQWHNAPFLWSSVGGLGLVLGNIKKNSAYEQIVTLGLSGEARVWITLVERVGLGLGVFGMLNQYNPYVGVSVTLGYGRFQALRAQTVGDEAFR
ncbi:MAG: hypothetical protein AABY83_03860 [Pseudomonadota bacterium]